MSTAPANPGHAHRCQYWQLSIPGSRHSFTKMTLLATQTRGTLLFLCAYLLIDICSAQELAPRAYLITPVHSNAAILTYSFFDGNLELEGAVPITGSTARAHFAIFSYYHSFNFFGRSANLTASLPYGVGNFHGTVVGSEFSGYRSGLLAPTFRLAMNLIGGPAMNTGTFMKWQQKKILGASIKLVPPAGQYDSTRLINFGTSRWALKPELGYSQRCGHWILDAYGGAWFYAENPEFFSHNQFSPGTNTQTQTPVGSFEGHLSYDFKPRLWISLDGNFWSGGETSLNGVRSSATLQRNSRVGITSSIPVSRHQSLKFSYNNGAYIRYGGNFQNVSVAWQYSWVGKPN